MLGVFHKSVPNFTDVSGYTPVYYKSHLLSLKLLFGIRLSHIMKDIGMDFQHTSTYLHIGLYTFE